MARIQSFSEFWPYYVSEHSHALNRALHFIGTSLTLVLLVVGLTTQRWLLLAAMPLAGYGFAWVGHFFVEKNRPATFTYPVWSFMADFVMYGKIWTRRMSAEVAQVAAGRATA
jgi:hypothetical protein